MVQALHEQGIRGMKGVIYGGSANPCVGLVYVAQVIFEPPTFAVCRWMMLTATLFGSIECSMPEEHIIFPLLDS